VTIQKQNASLSDYPAERQEPSEREADDAVAVISRSSGEVRRHERLVRNFLLGIALLPPIFLALAICKYAVNTPTLDEWQMAPFFEKFSRGTLRFTDLFALQNEYRQFFPNLIIVALGWVTHWDPRVEMALTFSFACFIAWGLWRVGKRTFSLISEHWLIAPAILLASNLLIFSFTQLENWLMGEQFEYFMPLACLVAGLTIAKSGLGAVVKVIIFMGLCTLATFSMPSGIFCWILLFPRQSLFLRDEKLKARWHMIWIAVAAAELAFYLYGYRTPSHHQSPLTALYQPYQAGIYFLAFLGSPLVPAAPFALRSLPIAVIAGALLVTAFLFVWISILRCSGHACQQLQRRATPWLVMGWYSILTGGMIAIGRVGFGPGQALSSRYISLSLYLIIALAWLILSLIDHRKGQLGASVRLLNQRRKSIIGFAIAFATALVGLTAANFQPSIREMQARRQGLLYDKSCICLINYLSSRTLAELSSRWGVRNVPQTINKLGRLDLLQPAPINDRNIQNIAPDGGMPVAGSGYFDEMASATGIDLHVSGWAVLANRGEPAHASALTCRDSAGRFLVFDVLRVCYPRPDVVRVLHNQNFSASGWSGVVKPPETMTPPVQIDAWAIDAIECKAYRLAGSHSFDLSPKTH
jgi:hypothetical protein